MSQASHLNSPPALCGRTPQLQIMSPVIVLAFAMLFLVSCKPAALSIPLPTPIVLTVQVTPALKLLGDQFNACGKETANTGLVLLDTPAAELVPGRSALALRWGAGTTASGYAYVIGQEELVIVANPQNPRSSISLVDLRAIYTGALKTWQQSDPPVDIQPWTYLTGDDARAIFDAAVLNGQPASPRAVFLAPDPAAMREAVAGNRGAIGFLPRRWLDPTIKALALEGLNPSLLRQPILALSPTEPQGAAKSWLLCLQKRLSG